MSDLTPVPDSPEQDPDHVDDGPTHVDVGLSDTAHSGFGEDIAAADERRAEDGGASVPLDAAPDDARSADADPLARREGSPEVDGPH